MSGGFGIIIGYVFAFLALIGVFFGALATYTEQIEMQEKILKTTEENSALNINYDYEFTNPYYSSGRISYNLQNGNSKLLFKKDNNDYCFNFYINSNYISQTEGIFVNFDNKVLTSNYRFIPENSNAIFTLKNQINISAQNTIKTSSCEQIEKIYYISPENLNWWNSSFEKRKKITVSNVASIAINDYQVPVILTNSNFNFAQGREEEIRFVLPIKENYVLDLPFDDNAQMQNEYSKYSNIAYLGTGIGSEANDPTFTRDGIILSALNFDGVNDIVNISQNSSLQLNKSLTYSMWIKWSGVGNNNQYLFTNGHSNNSFFIINDGGANDNKVQFQLNIAGTLRTLISSTTLDNNWHLITATFDGYNMDLYIDKTNVGSANYLGDVIGVNAINYIGTNGSSNFFNGTIDEIKIYNMPINSSEVEKLYYNNLRFKELDFYVSDFNPALNKAKVFVKVPYIHPSSNVTFDMYYFSKDNLTSASNIETTFSYEAPRTVGYVVSARADAQGASIYSLYDNNVIYVGNDVFSLDKSGSSTNSAANTLANDVVKMKYLAQVEGGTASQTGTDIIVPISWAGRNFTITNNLNVNDYLCFFAPFATTPVTIYSNGVLQTTLTATLNALPTCDNRDYVTGNNVIANSTYPVLAYYSNNGLTLDSMALIPANNEDWYGVASANMYVSALPTTSTTTWYNSNGVSATFATLTSTIVANQLAQGNQGTAPAFKLVNSGYISAFQSRDSDGSERSTFAPLTELSTRFGSRNAGDYVAIASPYADANCSTFTSAGVLVENIPTGTGSNGIYKYFLNTNTAANWYMVCDKAVWPYFDSVTNTLEKNLLGHLQIRQYIYPEPVVNVN